MEPFISPVRLAGFDRHEFYKAFRAYCREMQMQFFKLSAVISGFEKEEVQALAILQEGKVCAFLLLSFDTLRSSFFAKPYCFLRELWTRPDCRSQGFASCLMATAEMYCHELGIETLLLTTDSADAFFLSLGYRLSPGFQAENHLRVFVKNL